ncbi:MAG TPA: cytidylate kinase-like family protein [Smithella sp.]|nr:cytidylate kinase-like family protein [Smithella sp.]
MTEKTVITISRQTGSGGTYIGYLAAKNLGFRYLDREILRETANQMGMEPRMMERFDGRSVPLMERIINSFSFGTPEMPGVPSFKKPIYDKDLFVLQSKIIKKIAGQSKSVIVGRGGFYILKDRPDTLHVFIHAPFDYRVEFVMKEQKMDDIKAQAFVRNSDRTRAKFIRDVIGIDWMDARNFHLSLDSSVIGFDACVEMITGLVKKKATES